MMGNFLIEVQNHELFNIIRANGLKVHNNDKLMENMYSKFIYDEKLDHKGIRNVHITLGFEE